MKYIVDFIKSKDMSALFVAVMQELRIVDTVDNMHFSIKSFSSLSNF